MGMKAILFPGQGAQKIGMGADLYEELPAAREVYERANALLGFDLAKLCFEGPEAELNDTANCQVAILVTSIAALEALRSRRGDESTRSDAAAGLSLGEYTALCYAGAMAFEDAVRLVRQRGLFMKEAGQTNPGAMVPVLGMERDAVAKLIEECRGDGVLVAANFNCPGQIVLSGSVEAVDRAAAAAKNHGAKRAIKLAVSGAFHSPLMEPAAEKLRAELERTAMADPQVPIVSNVSARYVASAAEARELLARQLTSPVFWEDSMRFLIAQGMTEAVEVGPGRVLAGLLARTDRNVAVKSVESAADLAQESVL